MLKGFPALHYLVLKLAFISNVKERLNNCKDVSLTAQTPEWTPFFHGQKSNVPCRAE